MKSFKTIPSIPEALLSTLDSLHFTTMTEIQQKSIPPLLKGKDLLAQSKTGSGKTLAFALPLLIKTSVSNYHPQTLIIAPTRELAEQIAIVLRKVAAYKPNLKIVTLYGGVPLRSQADSLAKGAHILVGTPGRIQDHLSKGTLTMKSIDTVVLDEADRMLDMGFYDDIVKIVSNIPPKRQTLLFSATFPPKIETLAQRLLKKPLVIKIDTLREKTNIDEFVYKTDHKRKMLTRLIQSYEPESLLIFCNTKAEVISLTDSLHKQGHAVIDLHGDLDQRERNEAVILFANRSKRIMVATDVASRGLDIEDIALVLNYDLPFEREVYTHRIGRTGRADASGVALSLYSANDSEKCAWITSQAQQGDTTTLRANHTFTMHSTFDTLCLNGGKKTKLRKGDILGTLCKEIGIDNHHIGKIDITETKSYVALHHTVIDKVFKALKDVKIKKKRYVTWILR